MSLQSVHIFGSTGSIGTAALDVLKQRPEYRVSLLAFGENITLAETQVREFAPEYVACKNKEHAHYLQKKYSTVKEVFWGTALNESADIPCDIFLAAVSGSDGLASSMKAAVSAKRVALANKETMVMAGDLFNAECTKNGTEIIPVDSEHSAIYQCLTGEDRNSVKQIILTASGGPFRTYTAEQLNKVTPEMALKHPTWTMGSKITIDSATLANKGLELIEAVKLFGIPEHSIDVVIHPQSIIHSMVKFSDNSVKAQLGNPDMRLPIQFAFDYPVRKTAVIADIDFTEIGALSFEPYDAVRFPTVRMARKALREGGYMPLVFNRANEELVNAFLGKKIEFPDLFRLLEKTLAVFSDRGNCAIDMIGVQQCDDEVAKFITKEVH